MRHVLILIIVFISPKLNSHNIENNLLDSFVYTLPVIEVVGTCNECKIDSLKVLINGINASKLRELNDDEIITNYFPKLNGKLKNYQRGNYIAIVRMDPVWEYLRIKYKIPKFISISFWIEETGWGKSKLFTNHYNLGGIKCWGCSDSYKAKDDCGDNFCDFRKFGSLLEGIDFWAKILTKTRYLKHIKRNEGYRHQIRAYQKGGYWTSPTGSHNRIQHVKKLNLNKL